MLISGYGIHGGMHPNANPSGYLFVFVGGVLVLIVLRLQYWWQGRKIKIDPLELE